MTTGNIVKGSASNTPYYFTKVWSGTDGRYDSLGNMKENPYTMSTTSISASKGMRRDIFPPHACTSDTSFPNVFTSPATIPRNFDLSVQNKLVGSIKGHSFNLGTFTATSGQLVQQTLSTLGAVTGALVNLRRGNLAGALQNLAMTPGQRYRKHMNGLLDSGDISGTWLAMQYGWLPTLSDLHDSAVAFSVLTSKARKEVHIVSKSVQEKSTQTGPNYDVEHYAVAGIRYKYILTEQLSSARSLGLYDPASIVWEVLPWSFVVDWFIPIGTYLENLNVLPFLQGRWVRSVRQKQTAYIDSFKGIYTCGANPSSHTRTDSLARTTGTGGITSATPSFQQGLGGKRILNAISLAHQKLRG